MNWLTPWYPLEDAEIARRLEEELRREVAESHPMFALPVKALGHRRDCDDVLFAIDDGSRRVAVVHLTWTSGSPDRPPAPWTLWFPSLETWIEQGMARDHDEYWRGDANRDGGDSGD